MPRARSSSAWLPTASPSSLGSPSLPSGWGSEDERSDPTLAATTKTRQGWGTQLKLLTPLTTLITPKTLTTLQKGHECFVKYW